VKLGLVSWQSLGLGMVAGYGFGWRGAVASLRSRYDVSRTKAYRAPLVPSFIILLSLVAALGIVLPFASSALDNGQSRQLLMAWLISLLAGSVAAFALALPKMQNNLRG
jgi:hypothetical protein